MPQPRLVSTQQIVTECERLLQEIGFCNYAEVARRLNVSRQTIQQRLRSAETSGEITPETAARYKQLTGHTTQRFHTSLSPENYKFIIGLAEQLGVPPSHVLHAAVTRYRESFLAGPPAAVS